MSVHSKHTQPTRGTQVRLPDERAARKYVAARLMLAAAFGEQEIEIPARIGRALLKQKDARRPTCNA